MTAIEKQKSKELAAALEGGKDIIITTLQTFPFVTDRIGTLPGKRFAVVIDEAHSSQSGETNQSLKQVLTTGSLEEAERQDGGEAPDEEDNVNAVVEAAMKRRGRLPNVSFFAFTATPKGKTMELFGTRQPDGSYEPLSLYSMRQAIEEKFILDVLKNYTTYRVYFSLLKKVQHDPQYDRKKGAFLAYSFANLHEHGIQTKTEIMVEHFHSQVRHRIGGQARAMVVTRSRLHAVRFKLVFERYLKQKRYPYKVLVAFSGEVVDTDTGMIFTEAGMNKMPEAQTAEAFKGKEYRFLIVAEKFQTGFDQPLLHTMYVDKKLAGVHAVQTLSRLNRTHPNKEDTFVLDFVNEAEEIQESFQPYYEATILSEATDPNRLHDLKRVIEEYHLFGDEEVEAFARIYFSKTGKQIQLQPILDAVGKRYEGEVLETRVNFRKHVGDYVRLYAFLSQILTFTDVSLEKFYQFTRHLLRKLPVSREELPTEITQNINMDSYRIQETSSGEIKLIQEDGTLYSLSELGTGKPQPVEKVPLSEIIEYINLNFGTEFTTEDRVQHFAADMERRLESLEALRLALDPETNPSEETRKLAFESFFNDTLEEMIDSNFDIYRKITQDERFAALFRAVMFRKVEEMLDAG